VENTELNGTIIINNGEQTLSAPAGTSLLSALARNSIFLPSACGGKASCGFCKVKVLAGAEPVSEAEKPLLNAENLANGLRLACQVKVGKILSIEIPQQIFKVKRFKGIVVSKKQLTYDTIGLTIELAPSQEIDFTAGQYVQIRSREYDGKPAAIRAYSIASAPLDKKHVSLIIRRVPNGICSEWIYSHIAEKQELYFSGPYGDFKLSDSDAPVIFIAGGSGMSPILSMIHYMIEKNIRRKSTYFFGALSQKDLFYTDILNDISRKHDWFTFVPALSNEPENSGWTGETGLINQVVGRQIPDCSGHEAYLCGSPGMINACIETLLSCKIKQNNIFFDKFAPQRGA
jgi:Na+-transporting NADH:ubiquinone oxidoreductase subunit F